MKKVVLKKVDLVVFKDFIDSIVPLSSSSSVHFKINKNSINTDAHNDSASVIKSLSVDINKVCEESNLSDLGDSSIRISLYEGKKVLKAFSYLSGNEINCEINFVEYDGVLYAESIKISSPRLKINLECADPNIFDFANVPDDVIDSVKDTSESDCNFVITSNEILQLKKFFDFDANEEIEFEVGEKINVLSEDSFNYSICDEFEGTSDKLSYKVSKDLFNLIDVDSYIVYPISFDKEGGGKIIFKSQTSTSIIIVTLIEDVDV